MKTKNGIKIKPLVVTGWCIESSDKKHIEDQINGQMAKALRLWKMEEALKLLEVGKPNSVRVEVSILVKGGCHGS